MQKYCGNWCNVLYNFHMDKEFRPTILPKMILWGLLKCLLALPSTIQPVIQQHTFATFYNCLCATQLVILWVEWCYSPCSKANISILVSRMLWQLRKGTTVWETRSPSWTATAVYFWYGHLDAFSFSTDDLVAREVCPTVPVTTIASNQVFAAVKTIPPQLLGKIPFQCKFWSIHGN